MHATTDAASALRAECARIAAAMSTLAAKLEEMKMALNALGAASASPQSPVMADIATQSDKAALVRVATDETVKETIGKKKTMCAFDNNEAMMAVAALFADSKSKNQKKIIDTLSNAKTMGAVARMFSHIKVKKPIYSAYTDDLVLLTVKRMFSNTQLAKATYCAYADDLVLLTVKRMFGNAKPAKSAHSAYTDNLVLLTVKRMFSDAKPAKPTYCAYDDDLVLQTVKRMFGKPLNSKRPANAMNSSVTMGAVAQLFSDAKAKQPGYDAYADDLVLLTVKRMFSEEMRRVATDALADEGTMQAVVALFEVVSGSADQPHCASRMFVPFEGMDIMALIKENDALTAAINWVCVQPYLACSNTLGSLESVDLACSCDEILIVDLCGEAQDLKAVRIAPSDNAVPQKETETPIDASFGMGAHVLQAYASASPSMLVGTALRAGLHAAFKVPQMRPVPEQAPHETLDGCDGCTGATHEA